MGSEKLQKINIKARDPKDNSIFGQNKIRTNKFPVTMISKKNSILYKNANNKEKIKRINVKNEGKSIPCF